MFNKIVHYTPQWHTQLLQYMKLVYPKRNINYLKWWLSNINISNSDCWRNCIIVLDDETIIGCTSVNEVSLIVNGIKEVFYFRGNTIISPNYRGKGISKVIYNSVNSYNNWISVGVTDIAWKIQPKYVKNFTPLRPINVYITLNFSIIKQALYKCLHRQLSSSTFPTRVI